MHEPPCVGNVAHDTSNGDVAEIGQSLYETNFDMLRLLSVKSARTLRRMGEVAGPKHDVVPCAGKRIRHERVAHLAEPLSREVVERVLYPDNHLCPG